MKGKDTRYRAPVHLRLQHADGSLSTAEGDDFRFSFKADSAGVSFFTEPLADELEITEPAAASLLISSTTSDADIFLTLRALDPEGHDVSFVAANDPHGVIATGWLRASHRKMDPEKSLPYLPCHTHDELQPLKTGEKAQMNIEIWPTSVNIGGRDFTFTDPKLTSRVDISHYPKNPKLIPGMVRALPMDQLFRILTHEKV